MGESRRPWYDSSGPPSPVRHRDKEERGLHPSTGALTKVACVCVLLMGLMGLSIYTHMHHVWFPGAGTSSGSRCVSSSNGDDKKYWRGQLASLVDTAVLSNHALKLHSYSKNASSYPDILPFDAGQRSVVWDYYPPTVSCPDVQRIGRVGDGGKWICALRDLEKQKNCVVYSYGVSIDASFEEELLLRTNCKIYSFDPTIGGLPHAVYTSTRQWEQWKNHRIFFHKVALDSHSGKSGVHMLTESIFDTMNRLNHTYIDVLKIDIEGFEWKLFGSFAKSRVRDSSSEMMGARNAGVFSAEGSESFPFGQLLIELHYQSMHGKLKISSSFSTTNSQYILDTKSFFDQMKAYNQHPYSREINLQPCLEGYKPFAVEYSFINPHLVYFGGSEQLPLPPPVTPGWPTRVKGVIYYLTQRRRLEMMTEALTSLYKYVWSDHPHYPVVIFNDDLQDRDKTHLQQAVPAMKLTFLNVAFKVPSNISPDRIPNRTLCAPDSSTIGYRHMCRFHATGVHAELLHREEFADIEYIVRLDDDSYFTAHVGYDLLAFMKINGKKYAFPSVLMDDEKCVRGLWNETKKYAERIRLSGRTNTSVTLYNEVIGTERLTFYNNFEISHVSLWSDPIWKDFINAIDHHGGIYTSRWGDAPIHTLGVSMLLSKLQVHSFTDVGYTHMPFIKQTPSGLPNPSQDPLNPHNGCKFYGSWVCGNGTGYSNSSFRNNVMVGYATMMRRHWTSKERHVIYTFGHKDREGVLSKTLNGLNNQYIRHAKSNIVVFTFKNNGFNRTLLKQQMSTELFEAIRVISVEPTPRIVKTTTECGNIDSEIRSVAEFMRFRAIDYLRDSLKFDWIVRVADESRFVQAPTYNAVDRMAAEGFVYAYASMVREYQPCSDVVWNISLIICDEITVWNSKTINKDLQINQCSSHIREWPHGVVALSNFEVSHSAIWRSTPCQLLRILSENSIENQGNSYDDSTIAVASSIRASHGAALHRSYYWSDGSLHTACMAMAAPSSKSLKLNDFHYVYTRTQYAKLQLHDAEKQESLPDSSEVAHLNDLFKPRKIGWLGGDVGTSFSLPCASKSICNDYIWLFGDSLVGMSNEKKRLSGHMVSNTVARLKFSEGIQVASSNSSIRASEIRKVDRIKYYWRESGDGAPSAIFSFDVKKLKVENKLIDASKEVVMWPIAGMSFSFNGSERAVIFGPVIQHLENNNDKHPDAMSFTEKGIIVTVVCNPREAPDSWIYSHTFFPPPRTPGYDFRWTALAQCDGLEYSDSSSDCIYLLGFHLGERQRNESSDTEIDYSLAPPSSYQVVGRIRASSLVELRLEELEVLFDKGGWARVYGPSADAAGAARPARLFGPRVTEASFRYDTVASEWQVFSLQPPQDRARLCSAARVEGPWSCRDVFEVGVPFSDFSKYITYAAKLHPEFAPQVDRAGSRQGRVLFSVVSNTLNGFGELYSEGAYTTYVPRFFSVSL